MSMWSPFYPLRVLKTYAQRAASVTMRLAVTNALWQTIMAMGISSCSTWNILGTSWDVHSKNTGLKIFEQPSSPRDTGIGQTPLGLLMFHLSPQSDPKPSSVCRWSWNVMKHEYGGRQSSRKQNAVVFWLHKYVGMLDKLMNGRYQC